MLISQYLFFKVLHYFDIIYILERDACPCGPLIMVVNVKLWRKVCGTNVSTFSLFHFLSLCPQRGKEWTTPFLALTHATALWEGWIWGCMRPWCRGKCSKNTTWVALIVLKHGRLLCARVEKVFQGLLAYQGYLSARTDSDTCYKAWPAELSSLVCFSSSAKAFNVLCWAWCLIQFLKKWTK